MVYTNNATAFLTKVINQLNNIPNNNNYPPCNIIYDKKNEYIIDIAVAGFEKSELEIVQNKTPKNTLKVTGKKKNSKYDEKYEYFHQGIAFRQFELNWSIPQHFNIKNVSLELGILSIEMKEEIPKEQQPVTYKIK